MKVGDKIEITKKLPDLTVGKIYEVRKNKGGCVYIIDDVGDLRGDLRGGFLFVLEKHYKLIKENKVREFRIGDKVEYEGREYFVFTASVGCKDHLINDGNYSIWRSRDELTLIPTANDVIEAWEGSTCIGPIYMELGRWTFEDAYRVFRSLTDLDAYELLMKHQKPVKTESELKIEELEQTIQKASEQIKELKGGE